MNETPLIQKPPHRICLWNTAFLGDAVLTLPLAAALHRAWPEAALDFWVRGGLESLFHAQPEFSRVVPVAKRGGDAGPAGLLRLVQQLRQGRYDVLVCAHTSQRSALAAIASGIPVRVGYENGALSRFAFKYRVQRRFRELDEIERLLGLLRPLGIAQVFSWPELTLAAEAKEQVAHWQRENNPEGAPLLGLHPGSVWPTKRWPAERFGQIAALATKEGAKVLVFAGPGEEELAQELLGAAKAAAPDRQNRLYDLSGRLNLSALSAFLGAVDCYVCNDSGPMHLAWPQRTPLVALFGPTTRELGFYPRGSSALVLETDLDCRPCGKHGSVRCKEGHHRCLADIRVDTVWPAVQERLYAPRQKGAV